MYLYCVSINYMNGSRGTIMIIVYNCAYFISIRSLFVIFIMDSYSLFKMNSYMDEITETCYLIKSVK